MGRKSRKGKRRKGKNNGGLTHNIDITLNNVEKKGYLTHRSGEPLRKVSVGAVVKVKPDEIHTHFKKPVVYFKEDSTGKEYTGIIERLNPRDVSFREYDLRVSYISSNPQQGLIAHLQQYVSRGDLIMTQAIDVSKRDPSRYVGGFMDYITFIDGKNEKRDLIVELLDYVFGRVFNVKAPSGSRKQTRLRVAPIGIKSEEKYLKYKDMIIHDSRP
jgi:hypothetical protein